ncbi:MAG: hypothetical protein QM714_16560 [Nocardioides sp.]|uniref:hypothetical protein n=1 Tax=Nocardioides sp. TaxID=35761 RepID=UPI0039E72369
MDASVEFEVTVPIAEGQYYLGAGYPAGELRIPMSLLDDGGLILLTESEAEEVLLRMAIRPGPAPEDAELGPVVHARVPLALRTWEGDPVRAPSLPPGRWVPELTVELEPPPDPDHPWLAREIHTLTFYTLDREATRVAQHGWDPKELAALNDEGPPSADRVIWDDCVVRKPGATLLSCAAEVPTLPSPRDPLVVSLLDPHTIFVWSDRRADWECSVAKAADLRSLEGENWQVAATMEVSPDQILRVIDANGESARGFPDPLATGPADVKVLTCRPGSQFSGSIYSNDLCVEVSLL